MNALSIISLISSILIPMLSGAATVPTVDAIKRASGALDSAPAWVKQLVVLAIAPLYTLVASKLGAVIGMPLPDLTQGGANPAAIQGLLAALLAFALKSGAQLVHHGTPDPSVVPADATPAPAPSAPIRLNPTKRLADANVPAAFAVADATPVQDYPKPAPQARADALVQKMADQIQQAPGQNTTPSLTQAAVAMQPAPVQTPVQTPRDPRLDAVRMGLSGIAKEMSGLAQLLSDAPPATSPLGSSYTPPANTPGI